MTIRNSRAVRLKSALDNVFSNRQHFDEDSFREIVHALNERIQELDALPDSVVVATNGDEIRVVTVMFVDVENSTRLAQTLEEEWKTLIGDLHRRIARVVEEWDGEVGQYLGDGLLCFFGARRSRDDDAARAVSCALAIQKSVEDYAPFVRERYREDLSLRIGISTGRVVVGNIGSGDRKEFVAIGSTTNLAARLQHLCPPRQVLIDSATHQAVRDRFLLQDMPPVKLKGFEFPVEYFLVISRLRQRSAHFTGDQIAGIALPFVDRSTEFNYLLRIWDEALRDNVFNVMTIYGDTGLGKSRVLQEALSVASDQDFFVVTLAARDEKRASSYTLLHDLVADLCNLTEGSEPSVIEARIMQVVADVWPGFNAVGAAASIARLAGYDFTLPRAREPEPLDAFTRWLHALAGDRALLVIFDNLHWADPTTLDLMEYLCLWMANTGGVLVATANPDFRASRPQWMSTCARYTEMTMGRLSDGATRAMIDSVLQNIENVPALLPDNICDRADGNPLFVEEFLRMLFDNGVFERTPSNSWRTNLYRYGITTSDLPTGLIGVFQARLDDLPPLARRVVQVASVLGETFWENAVSYVIGFDARLTLDDLVTRGMFVEKVDSTLENQREMRFRHTLHREVAYAMLTRADREKYHERAADWLAGYVFNRPDHLSALGEHLFVAQKREQAMAIYLAATEDRIKRGMARDALKLVEAGLACAPYLDREVALPLASQLWMWQAEALMMLRRYAEASAAASTALMLMDELPDETLPEERDHAAHILDEAKGYLEAVE